MLKPIAASTLVAGTLDIVFATFLTLFYGREPANMLRYVASGPFPNATNMGAPGALLGLLVHFTLMGIMATALMLIVRARPALIDTPYRTGMTYGVVTYFIMNWLVVPLRFGTPLPPKPMAIATQLFAHVVLVGIPIALIARHYFRNRAVEHL